MTPIEQAVAELRRNGSETDLRYAVWLETRYGKPTSSTHVIDLLENWHAQAPVSRYWQLSTHGAGECAVVKIYMRVNTPSGVLVLEQVVSKLAMRDARVDVLSATVECMIAELAAEVADKARASAESPPELLTSSVSVIGDAVGGGDPDA